MSRAAKPLIDKLDALPARSNDCPACGNDPTVRARIMAALERGVSVNAVALAVGCHADTIKRCVNGQSTRHA